MHICICIYHWSIKYEQFDSLEKSAYFPYSLREDVNYRKKNPAVLRSILQIVVFVIVVFY